MPPQTRITVVGVCMETDSFLPLVAIAKELQFQFVIYYDPSEFADTLRQLAEGEIDPRRCSPASSASRVSPTRS